MSLRFSIRRLSSHTPNMSIPTRKLNNGVSIPLLGYGTGTALFKSGNFDEIDRKTVDAIKSAIKVGITHLDGAELYNTEPELGIAIKESGLPRSSFFVTTKVIHNIKSISKGLEDSLRKLQLEYVDLYLIHSPWWAKSNEELQLAWSQMEEVANSGKAKAIGVSNYLPEHLEATLATAKIVPAINQVEFHPYLQRLNLVPFSEEHNIVTAAYGPLTSITKGKPGPVDPILERLAQKYGVSEEAVALRWCIDRGVVAITTSYKEERMKLYMQTTTFQLTTDEVEEVSSVGKTRHLRCNNWLHNWDPEDKR